MRCFSVSLLLLSAAVGVVRSSSDLFHGVNLGGWLVLESWITPSLYSANGVSGGKGEWEFCEQLGASKAQEVLEQHWSTWVNASHIKTLSAAGITHVRIPLGYWILGVPEGEPYVSGGLAHLDKVLGWLKSAGISAVLDLHGAPGSQNGHDNSGRSDNGIHWNTPSNVNATIDVLTRLAQHALSVNSQSATANVVTGIECLNEPWTTYVNGPIQMSTLYNFYARAYSAIRSTGFTGDIWIHDGFGYEDAGWRGFLGPPDAYSVYIDTHIYHAFGGERQQPTPWGNVDYTCAHDLPMIENHTWCDWTIVGEWSLATGLAKDPLTPTEIAWLSAFDQAQRQAYCPQCVSASAPDSPGKGSFFWNFRIETGYESWNYLLGLEKGFIVPPSTYTFTCPA